MSEGKGTSIPKKDDVKKDDLKKKTDVLQEQSIDNPTAELKEIFTQFLTSNNDIQKRNLVEMKELREAIIAINKSIQQQDSPTRDQSIDTPFPDRGRGNRRSSMFFGIPRPSTSPLETFAVTPPKSNIQVLQADIVYDKELKVNSLEGLQYLARQLQLLSFKYPGRGIKMAHMVSYHLRPHVLASWNSHRYRESVITGMETDEIMVEDWLSLNNNEVQAILIEAARPRTRELYSKELILFLGKGIPQTPSISTDNFSSTFYAPLMKSLTDLLHLHDLMSEETSNHSTNKSKMPVSTYGTRDSPGQIALWLISLGTQKDSILQWLSKDELTKHKTIEQSVKYIRIRLMEGRAQSEARQDFDAKLTPIRYEDLRYIQGESHARSQLTTASRPPFVTPRKYDPRPKSSFSSLEIPLHPPLNTTKTDGNDEKIEDDHTQNSEDSIPTINEDDIDLDEDSLLALSADLHRSRSAVSATFRGYCSELFVYGKCGRQQSGCTFDHSAAGQERCIQSFSLLTKRELQQHGQLEPWSPPKQEFISENKAGMAQGFKRSYTQTASVKPYKSTQQNRPYHK